MACSFDGVIFYFNINLSVKGNFSFLMDGIQSNTRLCRIKNLMQCAAKAMILKGK